MTIKLTVEDGDGQINLTVEGGAASRPTVEEDGIDIESETSTFNFVTDYDVTNPATGTVDIALTSNSVTVAGNSVSLGGSTTVDYVDLDDTGSTFPIPNADIANSSVTFAGNTANLGGSATVDYVDLDDTGSSFPIPNSDLNNSSVTVAGNAVSLGGSTSVAAGDLSNIATATLSAGQTLLYHATNGQFENADITGGNALSTTTGDASLTIDVDSNSIGSGELVNDSVTVAGNTVALGSSTTVSADDLSDIATSTESAGQLLLYHATNNRYENANLSAGNALSATTGDASVTLDVDSNSIDTDELAADAVTSSEISDGTVTNTDLNNSTVTVAGNSVSLGGSTAVSIDDLSDVASATESAGQVPIYDATGNQYENATLTGGSAISVTNGDASITIDTNLGNGVELDGSDNIRVNGGAIAGNVLSEDGTNPYQINLNIGNGVEDNSGTLRVNPAGFAGDGLKETSATTLGVEPTDFAGTLLSDDGSDNLQVDESNISHDGIDQTTVDAEDHHPRGGFSRADVTSQSTTANPFDSLWVDTSAAGGNVTVTLPADGDTADGDRVEVGVEDATNDTDVAANTGQSIIGSNPTLTQIGDTVMLEYKNSTDTWMVR